MQFSNLALKAFISPQISLNHSVSPLVFSGEFWLGLHKIYSIVDRADYILRIELEDWRANRHYIEYTFKMGGPDRDYALFLSRITGNIPNALPEQKEIKFYTNDHGSSTERKLNCSESDTGRYFLYVPVQVFL